MRKASEVLSISIKHHYKFDIKTCPIQQEKLMVINKYAFLRFLERNCWVIKHSENILIPSLLDPMKNTITIYTDSETCMCELESFRSSTINRCTLCSDMKFFKLEPSTTMFAPVPYTLKLIKKTDYFRKKEICFRYKGKKYLVDRAYPLCMTES